MEIIILIKANIRHKKGSFLSVLLLMFILSAALTSIISVNQNIKTRSGEALDSVGVGDLVVFISDLNCTDEMISKVTSHPEVAAVELFSTFTSKLTVNGISQDTSTFFSEYKPEEHPYQIYSEREMSFINHSEALKEGEIYVPISFMRLYECEIGDTAIVSRAGGSEIFKIKGFFEEPFLGAEMIEPKIALIGTEDFDRIYETRVSTLDELVKNSYIISGWNLVNIYQKQESTMSMSELRKTLNRDTDILNYGYGSLSKDQSELYTLMFTQIISGILYSFIILLFVIVLIVMGHSISTGIEMDYVNLGILKSQGFTKETLRKVFLYQYLLAETIGIVFGLLMSIPAIHWLNGVFVPLTGLLASSKIAIATCGGLLLLILMISCLFVFTMTKKISEISPMRAISSGRENVFFTSKLNRPIDGSALNFKLAVRQLTSNMRAYLSSGIKIGRAHV